jgi:hypothetical protein
MVHSFTVVVPFTAEVTHTHTKQTSHTPKIGYPQVDTVLQLVMHTINSTLATHHLTHSSVVQVQPDTSSLIL